MDKSHLQTNHVKRKLSSEPTINFHEDICWFSGKVIIKCTPLKSNIHIQNDAMFEMRYMFQGIMFGIKYMSEIWGQYIDFLC